MIGGVGWAPLKDLNQGMGHWLKALTLQLGRHPGYGIVGLRVSVQLSSDHKAAPGLPLPFPD